MDTELQEQMEQLLLESEDKELEFEHVLILYYKKAIREMKSQINALYMEYLDGEQKSLIELNKKLNNKQLTELKETIETYAEILNEYDNTHLTSLITKLENMQERVNVPRIFAVTLIFECILAELLAKQEKLQTSMYEEVYEDSFDKTVYTIQTYLGVGVIFNNPSIDSIKSILNEKYLGESFSTRIWKNQTYLISLLQKEITQGFIQGQSSNQVAERISKVMNVQLSAAKRLARTELTAIHSAANLQAFKSQNIEKYQLVATLDSRTSDICRSMNGNVYLVKEARRGVNLPPLHVNCRTVIVPYLEGNKSKTNLENGEKGYYKVDNISYKKWKNSIKK